MQDRNLKDDPDHLLNWLRSKGFRISVEEHPLNFQVTAVDLRTDEHQAYQVRGDDLKAVIKMLFPQLGMSIDEVGLIDPLTLHPATSRELFVSATLGSVQWLFGKITGYDATNQLIRFKRASTKNFANLFVEDEEDVPETEAIATPEVDMNTAIGKYAVFMPLAKMTSQAGKPLFVLYGATGLYDGK